MHQDFEIENGVLIKYHGSSSDVTIPDGVTEIGTGAFDLCSSLTSVTIPDSVTKIGDAAFALCESLTSVTIPDSVTKIGDLSFVLCKSLTSVTIPDSVTEIGVSAFTGCTGLTSVIMSNSVTEIGDNAFSGCTGLTSVIMPNSVTEIGDSVFSGCTGLTSVTIPNSVTKIGAGAFNGCTSLNVVAIPDSVTDIIDSPFLLSDDSDYYKVFDSITTIICSENSYAHQYCVEHKKRFFFDYQLEAFHGVFPEEVEKLSSPFLADEEQPFIFVSYSHRDRDSVLNIIKGLYEAGWKIWYDEGLTVGDRYDETLEEHVKKCAAFLLFVTENARSSQYIRENEIPWAQQYGKPVIKCILEEGQDIPVVGESVVTTVSASQIDAAFERVKGLEKGAPREAKGISVVINPADRKETIENGFAYCLYAEGSASLARSILLEAERAGCALYDSVENGEEKEKLKSASCVVAFVDKTFLADEKLTQTLTELYRESRDIAVCQLEELEATDLPEALQALYQQQWLNFSFGITPDLNTQLARHLEKRRCRSADVIPGFSYEKTEEGIVITRYTGLSTAPRLEREYFGIPVVKIAASAFENCLQLKAFSVPKSVTEIGDDAFSDCIHLTSITIPDGVTIIGGNAFKNCEKLTSVTIPSSVREIKREVFIDCIGLTSITISDGVTKIGSGVFCGCKSLKSIVLPNGVTEIGTNTFIECESLTSVIIPNSVTEIGYQAFFGCSSLTSVTIPNSVTAIGDGAFEQCSNLTIRAPKGSVAQQYAEKNGIPFEEV